MHEDRVCFCIWVHHIIVLCLISAHLGNAYLLISSSIGRSLLIIDQCWILFMIRFAKFWAHKLIWGRWIVWIIIIRQLLIFQRCRIIYVRKTLHCFVVVRADRSILLVVSKVTVSSHFFITSNVIWHWPTLSILFIIPIRIRLRIVYSICIAAGAAARARFTHIIFNYNFHISF